MRKLGAEMAVVIIQTEQRNKFRENNHRFSLLRGNVLWWIDYADSEAVELLPYIIADFVERSMYACRKNRE